MDDLLNLPQLKGHGKFSSKEMPKGKLSFEQIRARYNLGHKDVATILGISPRTWEHTSARARYERVFEQLHALFAEKA